MELSGRRITALPVRHAVPGVAYQFESSVASFVFSGDTTYHAPFWYALSDIHNLRHLMIEATFLNCILPGPRLPAICFPNFWHLDQSAWINQFAS
jgi:ribonuclease BN (tRNA processing enzyme)